MAYRTERSKKLSAGYYDIRKPTGGVLASLIGEHNANRIVEELNRLHKLANGKVGGVPGSNPLPTSSHPNLQRSSFGGVNTKPLPANNVKPNPPPAPPPTGVVSGEGIVNYPKRNQPNKPKPNKVRPSKGYPRRKK